MQHGKVVRKFIKFTGKYLSPPLLLISYKIIPEFKPVSNAASKSFLLRVYVVPANNSCFIPRVIGPAKYIESNWRRPVLFLHSLSTSSSKVAIAREKWFPR